MIRYIYFSLVILITSCTQPSDNHLLNKTNLSQEVNNAAYESINNFDKTHTKPGGSVLGAIYTRKSDNKKFVVKYTNKEVSVNEYLSFLLYKESGLNIANYILIDAGDNLDKYNIPKDKIDNFKKPYIFIASEFIDDLVHINNDEQGKIKEILDGFIIDAWLGNYDVIGMASDNIMKNKDYKAIRIDIGASLEYRAQGTAKEDGFNKNANEILFLLNKCDEKCTNNLKLNNRDLIMKNSAKVFKYLTIDNLNEGINKLNAFTDIKITDIINKISEFDENKKKYLINILIKRKNRIINFWFSELKNNIVNS